ncbi:MAG: prepilin peptidase [Roseburia sp.]
MKIFIIFIWGLLEALSLFFLNCYFEKRTTISYYDEKKEKNTKDFDIDLLEKKNIIIIILFSAVAGICGYFTYNNVVSYWDIIKLLIAYIGISVATIIDYKVQLIPNYLVLIMCVARFMLMICELCFRREEAKYLILGSFISAILVFVILFILSIISKNGIGMGDVKILTAMSFLCGIYCVLNTMIGALLICVLVSMGLILSKKKSIKDKIPFGPFIYLGYVIVIFLGAY